jgi:RHS repeat-associated protein
MTAPGATPVVTSFGYDAGGNTTGRVSGSVLAGTATGTVESVYDAENHLTAATNGTRSSVYAYDADGDRAATSIDGTQTVYLPGGTELSLKNGQVTATRIYTYQGTAIARRTATTGSNRLAWQWSDGAGSEWQVAAADTPAPLVRRADPFGGLRGPQPAGWSGDRGMAAGITDTVTGTLRLGARDYDPVTGTFTQPDPILDPTDPLQWNPYSYGAANPVDRPDPSGLAYCTSTACGGSPGSVGETGVITETPTRNTSSGSGGGGSRGGGSGGGSRYHGGGYNGGGHRATRYTTTRTPPRHTATKARYRPPTRPATVTPLPPPPNPYLLCLGCSPLGPFGWGLDKTYTYSPTNDPVEATIKAFLAETTIPRYVIDYLIWSAITNRDFVDSLNDTATGGRGPVLVGQSGEKRVRAKYDIGPRERYRVNDHNRISDGTNRTAITEVKNVKYLWYSHQLQDA